MLSWEFQEFYRIWLEKAENYSNSDLRDLFDKFFTLYVLYNRVYAEATFELARNNQINLQNRERFPDSKAATTYIVHFLGAKELVNAFENDPSCCEALNKIGKLIEHEHFYIKLDLVTGKPQPERDIELLNLLRSNESNKKATAITEIIYAIRCNTFHGHKQFTGVQSKILLPVTIILKKLIQVIYLKLANIS